MPPAGVSSPLFGSTHTATLHFTSTYYPSIYYPSTSFSFFYSQLINVDSVGGMGGGQNSLTDLPHAIERIVPMVDSLPGDIAIYHTGQSMLPAIPSGSLLHLRPLPHWQEFFGYGGVFVLELTDGRRITKQVMGSQLDLKTHVRCVSFNPDYPDEELPRSTILHVWRVVHCLTAL